MSANQPAVLSAPSSGHSSSQPHSLTIRIWPNIPILYPMALAALICGIISTIWAPFETITGSGGAQVIVSHAGQVSALIFLAVFAFTLVVVCTDIVFTGALIGIFFAISLCLALALLNIKYHFLGSVFDFLSGFIPAANAQFYFGIFALWAILMVSGIIYSRFHYVRFESNEVIVVGGVMDKRKRYSTLGMKYTKEVSDVFEYWLPFVRSGRLILRFGNEPEPVIIDHVLQVDKIIERVQHVSSTLQVSPEDPPAPLAI